MVLCASNADHTVVKLVVPPENSKPGDRVTFPGYNGEPAPANQVAKKKIFEKLAPQLHTDSNGIACWNSIPFTIGSPPTSLLFQWPVTVFIFHFFLPYRRFRSVLISHAKRDCGVNLL